MITRTDTLLAGAVLLALVLAGCAQPGDLMSPNPYFGVDNHGKRYVPRELHETYEVAPAANEWSE